MGDVNIAAVAAAPEVASTLNGLEDEYQYALVGYQNILDLLVDDFDDLQFFYVPKVQNLLNGKLRTFMAEIGVDVTNLPEWMSDEDSPRESVEDMLGQIDDTYGVQNIVRGSVEALVSVSKVFGGFSSYTKAIAEFLDKYHAYVFKRKELEEYRTGMQALVARINYNRTVTVESFSAATGGTLGISGVSLPADRHHCCTLPEMPSALPVLPDLPHDALSLNGKLKAVCDKYFREFYSRQIL